MTLGLTTLMNRLLRHNQSGATAVEFALLSPVVLALGFSGIELAYHAMARSFLEGAVRDASRFAITGNNATIVDPNTGQTTTVARDVYIRTIIKNAMKPFPAVTSNVDPLTVVGQVWGSYNTTTSGEQLATDQNGNGKCDPGDSYYDVNGNGQWDSNLQLSGFGGTGDVVIYTVDYKTPVIFGFLWSVLSSASPDPNNKYSDYRAIIAVRNEGPSTAVIRSC